MQHVMARLLMLLQPAAALHVAFVAPPASHYVPMLPIAHQLLEEGHVVSFLGFNETTGKISKVVPNAKFVHLGTAARLKDKTKGVMWMHSLPYGISTFMSGFAIPMISVMMAHIMMDPLKVELEKMKPDVLCLSFAYPTFYALGETLNIPVLGVGWASPGFLTVQNELPWSLEPSFGSLDTREDVYGDVRLLLKNLALRLFSFFSWRLGSLLNALMRRRMGHPRPLEPFEFDIMMQNPLILTTLPELTAGSPGMLGPYTFMVGILDHPAMGGNSIAKSDDAGKIVAWLDERLTKKEKVLYAAFGSEVMVSDEMARTLLTAFASCGFKVLWATKVLPKAKTPEEVFVTKFAPQRAVLSHEAVFGFLSHGGANSVNEALMMGKPMAIMPFFGDQMAVGVQQQALGVARLVRKDADAATLAKALRELATNENFARRAAEVKALNDEDRNIRKAAAVIVNHGSGKFQLNIPAPPAIWQRLLPLLICVLLLVGCCNGCCCLRLRCQACRPCRQGKAKVE